MFKIYVREIKQNNFKYVNCFKVDFLFAGKG